ncbi:hypothetical protein CAAN4_D04060 [[Candida] anglica]|uniref:Uncharacterized protein n=1 Tax=[Candida] anglica TaxID=148631 RepID=A0ABP0EC94_9ASCO
MHWGSPSRGWSGCAWVSSGSTTTVGPLVDDSHSTPPLLEGLPKVYVTGVHHYGQAKS